MRVLKKPTNKIRTLLRIEEIVDCGIAWCTINLLVGVRWQIKAWILRARRPSNASHRARTTCYVFYMITMPTTFNGYARIQREPNYIYMKRMKKTIFCFDFLNFLSLLISSLNWWLTEENGIKMHRWPLEMRLPSLISNIVECYWMCDDDATIPFLPSSNKHIHFENHSMRGALSTHTHHGPRLENEWIRTNAE